uniref:Prolyl 4-hydroxylase alpha subunit domain-containing protein n=1 Tax=Meloidogyne floridensis TaxID=298350 RepID=A0A915P041_9BILA
MGHFLQNEDIRNTWPRSMLKHCLAPSIPSTQRDLNCFIHQFGFEQLFVEVLNRHPPIIRLPHFLGENQLNKIEEKLDNSSNVESMGVEGLVYSSGHRGRQAEGLWLSHEEKEIRPLYRKLRKTLALNPAMGEDFLILSYQQFGHYAPHFDHLEPMPVEYDDGWFAYFGNRLATALLIVKTAKGSFTTFPNLNLTVGTERGTNALKCSLNHPSYEPEDLIKRIPYIYEGPEERPDIPSW